MRKRHIRDYFLPASKIAAQCKIKEQTKPKKAKFAEGALAKDEDLGSETSKESEDDDPHAVVTNEDRIKTKKFKDLNVDSRMDKLFPIPFHDFLQYTNVLEIVDAEIKKSRKNSHENFIHDMKYVQKIARRCYDHFYTKPGNRKCAPLKFIKLSEESPAYVKKSFMDIPEEFQKQTKKAHRKHAQAKVSSAIEMKDDGLELNSCLLSKPAEITDSHLLKDTDSSNSNYPPSFDVFRKFVNFEEEFAKRKMACAEDINVNEKYEKAFYKEFYSAPSLRHNLNWKLRPCPRSIKDQILTRMPLVDNIIPNDCFNSLASSDVESHFSIVSVVENPESNKSSEIDLKNGQLEKSNSDENYNLEHFGCDKDNQSNVSRIASNLDEPIESPKSIDLVPDNKHGLLCNKIFTDGLQDDMNCKNSDVGNEGMLPSSNKRSASEVSDNISPPAKKQKTVSFVDLNNKLERIKDKLIEDYVAKKTKYLDEYKRKLILKKVKEMDREILIVEPKIQNQISLIEQKSSKPVSELQENSVEKRQANQFGLKKGVEEMNSISQRKTPAESPKNLKERGKQFKSMSSNTETGNIMSKEIEMLSQSALEQVEPLEDQEFFCKVPKNHTIAYVVRLSRGLKQQILRAILKMTSQDFYKYTRIQGNPNIYENSKNFRKIYEFAIVNEQTWPLSLYMTLHDMLEYLATQKILFEDFSLIHISPKLVHYEELTIITNFDEIVRFDYFKETNKELDDLFLSERRRQFYKRCWAHDTWIWRVPTLVDYWALAIMENYSENSMKSTLSICTGTKEQSIQKNEPQMNRPTLNNSGARVASPILSHSSTCTSLLNEQKENVEAAQKCSSLENQNLNTHVRLSLNESTDRVELPILSGTHFSNTILDKNNSIQETTHNQNPTNQVLNNSVDKLLPTPTSKNKTPLPLSPNIFLASSGSTTSQPISQQSQSFGAQKENNLNINSNSVCIPSDNHFFFISVENTQQQIESLPVEETLSLDPLKAETMLENRIEKVPHKELQCISQSFNALSNSKTHFSIVSASQEPESNKSSVIDSKDAKLEAPKENENNNVGTVGCNKDTQINVTEIAAHSDGMDHDAMSNKIITGSAETYDLQVDMICKTNSLHNKALSNSETHFSIVSSSQVPEPNKSSVINSKDAKLEAPKENENNNVDTQINVSEMAAHSDGMDNDAMSNKILTGSAETDDLQVNMICKTKRLPHKASSSLEPNFSIQNPELNKSSEINSKNSRLETPEANENYNLEHFGCDKDNQINFSEITTHSNEHITFHKLVGLAPGREPDSTYNEIFTGSAETDDDQVIMSCNTSDKSNAEETIIKMEFKCLNQLQFCQDDSISSEIHVHALQPTPPIDIDDDDICKHNTKTVNGLLDVLNPIDETGVSILALSGTQLNENRSTASLVESDAEHHSPPSKIVVPLRNASETSINSSEDVELLFEINVACTSDLDNLDTSFEDSQNFSEQLNELNFNKGSNGDQTMTEMNERKITKKAPETSNQEKKILHPPDEISEKHQDFGKS